MQFQREIFGRDTRESLSLAFKLFILQSTRWNPKFSGSILAYLKLVSNYNI